MPDEKLTTAAERALAEADNNLFYTMSPPLLLALVRAFRLLEAKHPHLLNGHGYYEFGIFKGFSLWFASALAGDYKCQDFMCYGFDSFEGMGPTTVDAANPYWRLGAYKSPFEFVKSKLERFRARNVALIKGYFSAEHFATVETSTPFKPCAICVIDSDTYEAGIAALNWIGGKLQVGSILMFDDFDSFVLGSTDEHGERRALKEWQAANPTITLQQLFRFDKGAAFRITAL